MPQVCLWLYLQTCSQAFSCPLDFLSILNVTKSQGGIWGVPQSITLSTDLVSNESEPAQLARSPQ